MATDARGHTVPAGTDAFDPQNSDVALSLTINDLVMCTNGTDETTKLAALGPTAARPVFTYRQDTDEIHRANGTTVVTVASVALGLGGGAWTAYTPAIGGTTSPTITYARWVQVGKIVTVQVLVTLTAAATGTLSVACPLTPRAGYAAAMPVGMAEANSGAAIYMAPVEVSGSTLVARHTDTGLWGTSRPITWAAGNTFALTATYEAA